MKKLKIILAAAFFTFILSCQKDDVQVKNLSSDDFSNAKGGGNVGGGNSTNRLVVGSKYQGGIIAYILQPNDPGYVKNKVKGIIAAEQDQSERIFWGYLPDYVFTKVGANGTSIGTGNLNTNIIINALGYPSSDYAAAVAKSFTGNGYTDWFLPSKDELNKLYLNRNLIGGFTNDWYWTSSEINEYYAEALNFATGNFDGIGGYKGPGGTNYKVRAIRVF